MDRKPDGYYTILVSGALARLRNMGNDSPEEAHVLDLLREMKLIDPPETVAGARDAGNVAHRFHAPVVRRVDKALSGITWKWEDRS